MNKINLPRITRVLTFAAILSIYSQIGSAILLAAPGDFDSAFGSAGVVSTDFYENSHDIAVGAVLQRDGKILVAGECQRSENPDFCIARYDTTGALDLSFGDAGQVITGFTNRYPAGSVDVPCGIVLQSDQSFIVFGSSDGDFALARYTHNGVLDPGFSGTGKVTTDLDGGKDVATCAAIQSDGRIIVAGTYETAGPLSTQIAIVRYNPDGTLDYTFNGTGRVTVDLGYQSECNALTLQADEKIVVAGSSKTGRTEGSEIVLLRCNSDGTLDNGLNQSGVVISNLDRNSGAKDVIVLANGKILVGGTDSLQGSGSLYLRRYKSDGTLDKTFDRDGALLLNLGQRLYNSIVTCKLQDLVEQPDGKVLIGAWFYNGNRTDFALVRLNPNGQLDSTFSKDGIVTTGFGTRDSELAALLLQPDGQILAVGSVRRGTPVFNRFDFAVVRYQGGPAKFRPDALIGFSASAMKGALIYNSTGALQTLETKLSPGQSKTSILYLVNRGLVSDSIAVNGTGPSESIDVRYIFQQVNVTARVVAGTFVVRVPRGGRCAVKVVATSRASTPGVKSDFKVDIRSLANSDLVDAVVFGVSTD